MPDLTLQLIVVRVLVVLLLSAVQGGAVAAAAVLLGDQGPRHDGRLGLSPFRHLDVLGAAGLVVFGLGWSKPVAIDPAELRFGRLALVPIVLAGTVALLSTAAVLHLLTAPALTTLGLSAGLLAAAFLRTAAALSVANGLFGLLPVPPLTGGHLLAALGIRVPARLHWVFAAGLLVVVAAGLAETVIAPGEAVLAPLLTGVD